MFLKNKDYIHVEHGYNCDWTLYVLSYAIICLDQQTKQCKIILPLPAKDLFLLLTTHLYETFPLVETLLSMQIKIS